MIKQYKIHPAIGIARVGNSTAFGEEGYYIGPEVPDLHFLPGSNENYRDANQNIRRQAARFRIYEYTYSDTNNKQPQQVREITSVEADIEWHVHLSNRKSFTFDEGSVVNDPGEITIPGINAFAQIDGEIFDENVQLGNLITDQDSRLLVLGGFGRSASPSGESLGGLFNSGWFDDVSDGRVRATVRFKATSDQPQVVSAWVIVGVPAYATPIINIVSGYDLVHWAATELPSSIRLTPPTDVYFSRDIYPVLKKAVFMQWVSSMARSVHSGGLGGDFLASAQFDLLKDNNPAAGSTERVARERVFRKLRNPIGGGGNMPLLSGGLTVTPVQYEQFLRWSVGDFISDWNGDLQTVPFEQLPAELQPEALDRAALESMVGGSFAPGIEAGQIFGDAAIYERPFRIRPRC